MPQLSELDSQHKHKTTPLPRLAARTHDLTNADPPLEHSNMEMFRLLAIDSPFDPSHRLQTSWALPPLLLGFVRLLFSVYIFQYLFYRIAYSAVTDGGLLAGQSFSYFTNITYWSLGFYFAFAGFHTVIYALRGTAPLQRWPKALQFMHALFYSSITTFSFLVYVVVCEFR